MISKIKKHIIEATCSKSLQKAIQTTEFVLSDFDLLILAYEHAPDYDSRLSLLNLVAICTDDVEVKEQAERCIAFEKGKLNRLMETETDCVFEVKIKEKQSSWEERYLAKTFSGALRKVEHFYMYYTSVTEMSANSRFEIIKRKVVDEMTFEEFEEDWCGDATYSGNSVLIEVSHKNLIDGWLDGDNQCDDNEKNCRDCSHKCFTSRIPKLPQFLKSFDLVCYDNNDEKEYAVVFVWTTEKFDDDDCAYCIPLEVKSICNTPIKSKKAFWDLFLSLHQHIQYPIIEIIQEDDLPEDKKKAYKILMRLNGKYNNYAK